jgi:hypothetical protein
MEKSPQDISEYHKTNSEYIGRMMIIGAIFQIFTALFFVLLSSIPFIVQFDVIYWLPFLNFSMKYYYFWISLSSLIIIWAFFTMVFAVYYKKNYEKKNIQMMINIIACSQLLFMPIGTFYGVLLLKNRNSKAQIESIARNKEDFSIHASKNEISKLMITISIFDLTFLVFVYLLTIYFSTVMLDMTFPFLVIDTIYSIRNFLLVLACILILQIVFGILYKKHWKVKVFRIFGYFFCIFQLMFIPIGTYAAVSLFKSLDMEKSYQNQPNLSE